MSAAAPEPPNDDTLALAPAVDNEKILNVGGDQVIRTTAELPEAQREAIRWLFSLARSQQWNGARLSELTGIHGTTLMRVFTGTYGASLEKITERIDAYRSKFEDRSQRAKKFFVETSMAKKIFAACDYARRTKTLVFVYGPSHFGKSEAAKVYKDRPENNHGKTKYMRMPASSGVQLMMKEFARACYVSPNSCFENLREYVLNAIDDSHLVLVDELHEIFVSYQRGSAIKCLEVIREIHDRRGCGMVLFGTNKLEAEMMMGDHQDLLQQFKERCVLEVQLPRALPRRDLLKIAAAFGLPEPTGHVDDPRSAAYVVKDVTTGHGLKRFVLFLQDGKNLAHNEGKRMSWDYFVRAHDIVAKMRRTTEEK